ncbi:hypothetical protein C0J52_27995, partial [Blattella germanica]
TIWDENKQDVGDAQLKGGRSSHKFVSERPSTNACPRRTTTRDWGQFVKQSLCLFTICRRNSITFFTDSSYSLFNPCVLEIRKSTRGPKRSPTTFLKNDINSGSNFVIQNQYFIDYTGQQWRSTTTNTLQEQENNKANCRILTWESTFYHIRECNKVESEDAKRTQSIEFHHSNGADSSPEKHMSGQESIQFKRTIEYVKVFNRHTSNLKTKDDQAYFQESMELHTARQSQILHCWYVTQTCCYKRLHCYEEFFAIDEDDGRRYSDILAFLENNQKAYIIDPTIRLENNDKTMEI